jgi:hypothetical protein
MRRLTLVIVLMILGACHAQAPRVRCDRKLLPINAPAPIVKDQTTSPTP